MSGVIYFSEAALEKLALSSAYGYGLDRTERLLKIVLKPKLNKQTISIICSV